MAQSTPTLEELTQDVRELEEFLERSQRNKNKELLKAEISRVNALIKLVRNILE